MSHKKINKNFPPDNEGEKYLQTFLEKIWQDNLQFLDFNANFEDKNILDVSEFAIILSTNSNNYERYFLLNEFKDIFKKLNLRVDIFNIQQVQLCCINLLKSGFIDKNDLLKALKILEKISDTSLVITFIENIKLEEIDKQALFKANFKELDAINLELQNLSLNHDAKQRLQNSLQKFKDLEFNIAITGVMNAGKSSLLNALLKEDFLGTSNIPETANLTVLRYGNENKAKIYFWNQKEWENILKSSQYNKELQKFVDELSQDINIKDYIKDGGLTQEIETKDLKNFSSAKNKLSALIKKIELKSKLDFLQNNICIVDTPGLDDVVVQREILTKEYIKESDFLIHLMNASQSLTQKDLEFLINCLLNSRLSKFLVVLTKADLLSESDLKEVINYTKQSLRQNLKDLDENLVENIDFLCVSSKKASDFYKGLENEEAFKQSGIKELETYLFNELYSGQKSKIALNAYKKELMLELNKLLDEYEMQNKLIKESKEGINIKNKQLLLEFKEEQKELTKAKEEINATFLKLDNIENGIENLVLLLAKKLKERLIDELKYLKSKSLKANLNRILSIVDITTKDGINDILRDVKFENLKRISELKQSLSLKYEFLQDDFDSGFDEFKEGISRAIENIFDNENFSILRMQISNIVQEKADIFTMEVKFDECINEAFKNFNLKKLLENLNINQNFYEFLNKKLSQYEISQKEKLHNLSAVISSLESENSKTLNSYDENLEKISRLTQLKEDLLNAN